MSEVESINPNTPITSNLNKDGAIEADATGGPLSFDELEELTMKSKKAKAEKKEEPKQEKSKDLTSDTDKGKKTESKSEQKEKAEKGEKSENKQEQAEKAARKLIKAKFNDSELDLDEEAVVPVKINGKEEMVQIKDLLGNYSGKVAWDKKFSELDQTRKGISAKELKVRQMEDMAKQIYEEQDPDLKMFRMAQLLNVDPVEYRQKFFDEQISLLEKYYSMTEDERKADALAYEAKIHKQRADTLERGIKEKQDFESLSSKVNQLRASHQVSEEEFVQKYDQLEQKVKNGHLDGKLVSPEYIIQQIQGDRMFTAAAEKLDSLSLGWSEQERNEKLGKLVKNAMNLGMKPQDMAEMVDELWGIAKAQKKIEAKKKENQEFLSGKKEVAQQKPLGSEIWSFDQI